MNLNSCEDECCDKNKWNETVNENHFPVKKWIFILFTQIKVILDDS